MVSPAPWRCSFRRLRAIAAPFCLLVFSSPLLAAPNLTQRHAKAMQEQGRDAVWVQRKPAAKPVARTTPSTSVRLQAVAPTAAASRTTGGSQAARVLPRPIGCTRQAPALTLSGGIAMVAPGGTSLYTVTLQNRDTAACGASAFDLQGVQPDSPGWSRQLDQTYFPNLAAGASVSTTYRVRSATSASYGAYQVYVMAWGTPGHNATAQSVYNVGAPPATCTRNAPTISLSGGGSAAAPGTAVSYSVTVRNNDTAACGTTNFAAANTVPAGWTSTQGYNTLTLVPGASQTSSLTVRSASSASNGSYPISARVSTGVSAAHTQSASGTYVVQATTPPVCTPATPELTVIFDGAATGAGTAKTYNVRLVNRDSVTCAATSFSLSRNVPTGWTSTLTPASGALAPGAALNAQLVVTSATTASQGAYNIGLGAASGAGIHTVSTSTTYTVSPPAATCTRQAPQVTVSGGATAVPSGTAVTYAIQVRNQDSLACGNTSFALSRTAPAGWTTGLNPVALTIAPGQVATSSLSVSSAISSAQGTYNLGVGVGSSQLEHSAGAQATYTVAPPAATCTRAPPQLTITGGTTAVPAGTAVSYSLLVRNQDSTECAASSFAVSRSVPAGWTSTLSPATLALAAGQSGTTTLSVTSVDGATAGSYPVGVGVASGVSEHTISSTGIYQVQGSTPPGTSLYKVDVSFVNKSLPSYTAFKAYVDAAVAGNVAYGFSAYDAAYLFLLDPQVRYCTLSVQLVERQVSDAEAAIAAARAPAVAGDSYLEVGDYIGALAMTLHACPNQISAAQRTRWGAYAQQAVWNVWNHQNAQWGGRSFPWSGWSVNNPGNNYQYSFLEATMSWGLVNGDASWISFLQTQKLPPLKAYFQGLPGGGSLEGTGYGTAHMRLFTIYKLWKDSTGEDLANFSSHATDTIPYWVHATVPTLDRFAGFGDQSRVSEPTLYDYQRRVVIQARHLSSNPVAQSLAAWWLNNISIRQMSSSFNRRYDLLPAGDPATSAPAQLQYHASGVGQIFSRSDWTPNAMWVAFIAGTFNESHAHQEQGGFTLFSQQDWQAVSENIWTHSGIQQGTETNNVLRFERAGAIVPQRVENGTPTLTYTPGAGSAFTATTNLTPVYGGNTAVGNWVRSVNFANRKLTVTDNFTLGSGATATFQVNVPTQPTVMGNVITAGGIQMRVLQPSNPTITLKNWRAQDASEFNSGWRVDIGGGTSQYVVEILDR